MSDRASAAGDENRPPGQGAGCEPLRTPLGNGQRAVCGERGNAEARAEVERRAVGQRDGLSGGEGDVLLCRSFGSLPGRLPQPDPFTDPLLVDAAPDRFDDARAVLVRDPLNLVVCGARTTLPVGGVHPRDVDTDQDLAGAGLWDATLDLGQDFGPAAAAIDNCSHRAIMRARSRLAQVVRGEARLARRG